MALLTSPVRREIMQILGNLPVASTADEPRTRAEGLTASELGDRIGLHATTVRFHVDQLLGGGLLLARDVKVGVGRPRRHYVANPGSITTSEPATYRPVSYTHLDVYKRQGQRPASCGGRSRRWTA